MVDVVLPFAQKKKKKVVLPWATETPEVEETSDEIIMPFAKEVQPQAVLPFEDSDSIEMPKADDDAPIDPEDWTAGQAMWFAAKLGLKDTYRGAKQILDLDLREMSADQRLINKLMQHPEYGGRVMTAYYGGMVLDPAGWFIPATKAKNVSQMAKHGLMWGGAAGAAGYVDPEIESLVGEGQMTRPEQAAFGAAGGAVLSPFMGKMIQLGKKGYAPIGDKVWKAISKNPEAGTGLAGGVMGYNVGEDTTVQEDIRNALIGALVGGVGIGHGARQINKATSGGLGRLFIADYGLTEKYLREKGMSQRDAAIIAREVNDIFEKFADETPETRELLFKVIIGEKDLDDPFATMAASKGWTLKNVGKGRPDFEPNPRATKADGSPQDPEKIPFTFARESNKTIYFDPLLARQKFDAKAWRTPREAGVDPLDDSLFPTYRDWENFAKTHEVLHITNKKLPGESDAAFENRINQLAIAQLKREPIDIPLQKLADEYRDLADKYGKELVDLGVLHKDTFEKNRLTYLHRIFMNPNYQAEKSKFAFVNTGDEIRSIGDELKMRGKPLEMSGEDWEINRTYFLDPENGYDVIGVTQKGGNKITHLDDDMMEKLIGKMVNGVRQPPELHAGSIDRIMGRKDWTPEERTAMGEITDAAIAINRTGQLLANDVSAHRFFKTIADEYAITPEVMRTEKGILHGVDLPEGYNKIAVPDNKAKFGELAGKYLPENIYHDIVSMDAWRSGAKFKNPIMKHYRTLNSWWKLTKTAYNAPVHTSNFSSNIAMYDFNGGTMKGMRQAFRDLLFPSRRGESERLKLAREHGVFGGNYIGNEVLKKNKQLYMAYGNALNTGEKHIDGLINKIPETILKVGKKAKDMTLGKAQELYTWEDSVFRLGLFNTLLDEGVDPITAARRARQGFVDYERSSPMLEVLRHSAIPFAAYGYGIAPRIAESMAKRPWKFAKWAAIIAGINAIGEDLTNDPEKVSRERMMMGSDQDRRLLDLPSFMSPTTMIKMPPQFSSSDESRYLNMARMFPGQFAQYTQQGHRIPGLPDVMQPTFGAAGSALMAGLGINTFTGEEIPPSGRVGELARQFTPNLPIPGLGTYAGTKMDRGLVEGGFKSQTKENQTLVTAILQNLGIRLQTVDLDKLSMQQFYRFKKKYDNISKQFRKLERDFEEGIYAGKEKKYQSKQKKLYAQLQDLEEVMMRKGL